MKLLILSLTFLGLVSACTSRDNNNNTHDTAPIYEQSPSINSRSASDKAEVLAVEKESRERMATGKMEDMFLALETMEQYVLNIENLKNPEIHYNGTLREDYRKLMDLYGYMMVTVLGKEASNPRMAKLMHNYKAAIFSSCNLEDIGCRDAAAFKGPYGVSILNSILSHDISVMRKNLTTKKPTEKEIKDTVFGLYVLKNFSEKVSNIHGDLFISFSSIFFKVIDIENNKDPLLVKYLVDLQNIMVRMADSASGSNACSIFEVIDPLEIKEKGSSLKESFVIQISKLFYSCNTAKEILDKIVKKEEEKVVAAQKEVDADGDWSKLQKNIHARSYILHKSYKNVLSNFSINKTIPLQLLHVFDEIYYGKIGKTELNALLDKFTQEELIQLIEFAEQYSQENFIYLMQYTFNSFDNALEGSFEKHKSINKEFVQSTYDSLTGDVGDMWVNFKNNTARLHNGLSDINVKLSASNRLKMKIKYDDLKDDKLEKSSLNEMINISVTFPIVMATTYFSGVDGGGTMELTVTWLRGSDNKIEISTVDPLKAYFLGVFRNNLQVLDFGYLSYQPNEYQLNVGLSLALRSGFFDVVNFGLGEENKGLDNNLRLFFAKYVDDNKDFTEYNRKEIENIRKIKDNHWAKVQKFCQKPISSERKIDFSDLYDNIYFSSRQANESISNSDLSYVGRVLDIKNRITMVDTEVRRIKRTYQILITSLKELGLYSETLRKSLHSTLVPHFGVAKQLMNVSDELLEDIGGDTNSCLYSLGKIQRFQQNILQRQTIEYIVEVHALMSILRDLKPKIALNESADELTVKLNNLINSEDDPYTVQALSKVVNSKVLSVVEEQLSLKGYPLLLEAFNLSQSPHNHTGDFGYSITGMSKTTSDLGDTANFLGRRGGFDDKKFDISHFDQNMRVREDLYKLSATVGEIKKYFGNDPVIHQEIKNLSDNKLIKLNPNIEVHIKNFKHFKDKLGTDEKRSKINYASSRESFVKSSIEKFYGNNQEGQHLFNWNIYLDHGTPTSQSFANRLEFYKHGPVNIPLALEEDSADLTCFMDSGFDVYNGVEGCERIAISAKNINDQFIKMADTWYLSDEELYPLLQNDGSDTLSDLAAKTIRDNENVDIYKPGSIWNHFAYYKFKENSSAWTWFDQFIAKRFTTAAIKDQKNQSLNLSILPGSYDYQKFYEQVDKINFEEFLLPISKSPRGILRNYYRSEIMKNISIVDDIVEDVIEKENTYKKESFPYVALKYKDIPDISNSNLKGWAELPLNERSSGSLILLGKTNHEVNKFQIKIKTEFQKFQCDLLPVENDADYSPELAQWINTGSHSCESKVIKWLQFKNCSADKVRAKKFENYEVNCPQALEEN